MPFEPLPLAESREPTRAETFLDIEVYGSVFATSGTFSNITLESATITGTLNLDGSGIITTDDGGGGRLEIVPWAYTSGQPLKIYSGLADEKNNAYLSMRGVGGGAELTLIGPDVESPLDSANYGHSELILQSDPASNANDGVAGAALASYGYGDYHTEANLLSFALGSGDADVQITASVASGTGNARTDLVATAGGTGTGIIDLDADDEITLDAPKVAITGDIYFGSASSNDYIEFDDTDNSYRFFIDGTRTLAVRNSGGSMRLVPRDSTGGADDTYLGYDFGSDEWRFYVNGTQELMLDATKLLVPNVNNDYTGTGDDTVLVDNSGQLHIDTSILAHKQHVRPAPEIADYDLVPIFYEKNGIEQFGFAADHLAAQDKRLGTYDGGGALRNYRDRALLAVMAAKINRLEAKVL